MAETQIKSRDRVRDLAEVYTAEREVKAMLDLLGPVNANLTATYLEPACGNGNFLIEILHRKLEIVKEQKAVDTALKQAEVEFMVLKGLASIHGIDICEENVLEARDRLRIKIVDFFSEHFNTWKLGAPFRSAVDLILQTNIQRGDMLNGTSEITITEWKAAKRLHFIRKLFAMDDMLRTGGGSKASLKPVSLLSTQHYRKLT